MSKRYFKSINIIVALLLIMALLLMQGCKKKEAVAPEPTLPVADTITYTTYNQFALDLLRSSRNNKENIMISPVAIGITMTVMRMGAEGDTAKGIDNTLGMTIPDFDDATTQMNGIVTHINELKSYETGIALFIDEGPTIREDYAVRVEDNFDMLLKFMNFNSKEAKSEIKDWADSVIAGEVDRLVGTEELPKDVLTLLLNINSLDCVWEMEFDARNTRPMPFNLEGGKGVAAPTMRGKLDMKLYEDEKVTAGFIPIDGGQSSLAIIMPPAGKSLEKFIENITANDIEGWRHMAPEVTHFVNIPKLDWYKVQSFKEPIIKMGGGAIFDSEAADFSNLGTGFYLGDIWQTTIIRAVENGREESNITKIDLTRAQGNGDYFFSVDRPFLVAAIDNETGCILMIGTMVNPLK